MHLTIYTAVSIDGFIARKDDVVDFVSKASWEGYRMAVAKAGAIIVGRRTYNLMKEGGDLDGLKGIRVVVVTHGDVLQDEGVTFVHSPQDAIASLEIAGCREAILGGGGETNGSFLREGLVDEMILDVMPVAVGAGTRVFGEKEVHASFELLETGPLAPSETQTRYRVKK